MVVNCPVMSQGVPDLSNARRHFVIACDVSGPFLKEMLRTPGFRNTFISLFTNASASEFDPKSDEISFYQFGIPKDEFSFLKDVDLNATNQKKINFFSTTFIKDRQLHWSDWRAKKKSVTDYFSEAFQLPEPSSFGQGVSLSFYVYPIIMDRIPAGYAEDYVFIEISDFLTGSDFGNKEDFKRLRELYTYRSATPDLIQDYADSLDDGYYRIKSSVFSTTSENAKLAAFAYTIKPKIGGVHPESWSLFIDGNLQLDQKGYQQERFSLSPVTLSFNHNQRFYWRTVHLRIFKDGEKKEILYDQDIAYQDPASSVSVRAQPVEGRPMMDYDPVQKTYYIPSQTFDLPSVMPGKPVVRLVLEYTVRGDFLTNKNGRLGYSYMTSRTINKDQIHYSSSTPRIVMYYVLPAAALLLLVWMLTRLGRPKGLGLHISGYSDSYETVNYETYGKLNTPYKYWDQQISTIPCLLWLNYSSAGYWCNWHPVVRVSLELGKIPKGFDIYLKESLGSTAEFYPGTPLTVSRQGKEVRGRSFAIEIRQNSGYTPLANPELIELKLIARVNKRAFLGTIDGSSFIESSYFFHIGPDLKNVWIGFDPGTSGSCLAAGNSPENILIGQFGNEKKEIADSKIIFDTTLPYRANPDEERIPMEYYKYGPDADGEFGNGIVTSFQSIKKLLGFTDRRQVRFSNGVEIKVTGKKLSSLLVDGLYKDYRQFAEKDPRGKLLLHNGEFSPRRAVVAIPNNFTAAKIKDMLGCFSYLNQFKELRYIYEAEAVFFYYLYNYRMYNGADKRFSNENVLIFDMGGATINATVIRALKGSGPDDKYQVNILGKLGYGIGGDTIDYCNVKSILDHRQEFPAVRVDYPFKKPGELSGDARKSYADSIIALQKMGVAVKKQIISRYYGKEDSLVSNTELENILRSLQGDLLQKSSYNIPIAIDPDSDLYAQFKKRDDKGRIDLLHNEYFQKYIYGNIRDVVKDILDLCPGISIDTVIFSGRSCSFPMIKETVRDTLKARGIKAKEIVLDIQKSKTAVAVGACWYGISRNAVELNNVKTNASFGIQHRKGAEREDLEYVELVKAAQAFIDGRTESQVPIRDRFALDNNTVNFYQIMGSDATKILSENQNHKFSKIAAIPVDLSTSLIEIRVYENDVVECGVLFENNDVKRERGFVSDQEIADANDEHYTWIIQ